jgi:hypothetical protein
VAAQASSRASFSISYSSQQQTPTGCHYSGTPTDFKLRMLLLQQLVLGSSSSHPVPMVVVQLSFSLLTLVTILSCFSEEDDQASIGGLSDHMRHPKQMDELKGSA